MTKIIGIMITCNESHFLPYSLPSLLELVDEVFVLDASSDGTWNNCGTCKRITIYQETGDMTYKERRKFILDKAREKHGLGNIYISIDADEIISLELIQKLREIIETQKGPYTVMCNWAHPCQDFQHMAFTWNHQNPRQGIMFYDTGLDCIGNDLVHENKIPHYKDRIIDVEEYLIHFGLCDVDYIRSKARYYMLLEFLEDRSAQYLNLRYFRGIKVVKNNEVYQYPYFVSGEVFDLGSFEQKYIDKLCGVISKHVDLLEDLYSLDIWDNEKIIMYCYEKIPGFDVAKIKYVCRNRTLLHVRFLLARFIDIIKEGEPKYLLNHARKVLRI